MSSDNQNKNELINPRFESAPRNLIGSGIRGALKTSRRVGYAVTILPILLPILCLCILCILFLTIISLLSGGGPDQTQNISNATTECTGELDVCDRIQDSVRSRTGE